MRSRPRSMAGPHLSRSKGESKNRGEIDWEVAWMACMLMSRCFRWNVKLGNVEIFACGSMYMFRGVSWSSSHSFLGKSRHSRVCTHEKCPSTWLYDWEHVGTEHKPRQSWENLSPKVNCPNCTWRRQCGNNKHLEIIFMSFGNMNKDRPNHVAVVWLSRLFMSTKVT